MKFYQYETIPLKVYFEIIETGDLKRLVIEGEPTEKEAIEAWDKIIVRNNEQNGGYDFIIYVDTLQSFAFALSEYNLVKALLLKLVAINMEAKINIDFDDIFIQDTEIIEELKERRYNIDTSSAESFWKSLTECFYRSESLGSKLKMKVNELKEFQSESDAGKVSFDEIMAMVSAQIGFVVPDDVTLSRFNEYKKILKARQKTAA